MNELHGEGKPVLACLLIGDLDMILLGHPSSSASINLLRNDSDPQMEIFNPIGEMISDKIVIVSGKGSKTFSLNFGNRLLGVYLIYLKSTQHSELKKIIFIK